MPNSEHDDPPPPGQPRSTQKQRTADASSSVAPIEHRPPLEWKDLTTSVRERAINTVARCGRITRTQAEDLVVDAMVRLIRLRPPVRNPAALLTRAALNLLWAKLRRDKLREALPLVHESPDQEAYEPREPADERAGDAADALADREEIQLQATRVLSAL